jgi:hypothetical protein
VRPVETESFTRETLRNLVGMLLVSAIFAVPLLVVVGILTVLSRYIDHGWVTAIALTAIFLLVPLCMTAAFRFAKRHASRWPFS